ncbi:MAG: hypothetical protein ACIAQZ_12435 [Sedimentisphaeraceae bacterium JB056]
MNKYLMVGVVAAVAMFFAFIVKADNTGMRQKEQFEYKVVNVVTLLDIKSFEEAFNQALESNILNDPTLEKVKFESKFCLNVLLKEEFLLSKRIANIIGYS